MVTNRYLIKLSGEVLKGDLAAGISWDYVDSLSRRIAGIIRNTGAELAFVIGGGNIFRGASGKVPGYDRDYGDRIGMMATVMNGLSLVERMRYNGIHAILQSGINISGIADLFDMDKIEEVFAKKGCVVFCGGIGNPYFSTDTTAALRALQIKAHALLKATKVDGIYDKDPARYSDAVKFDKLTYTEILAKRYNVMDLTAIELLMNNKMRLMVLSMLSEGVLERACSGETVGTIVER